MSSSTISQPPDSHLQARTVAVIDIGTSSIRMAIAEIDEEGNIRLLDRLQQAVSLGKDSFTGEGSAAQPSRSASRCSRITFRSWVNMVSRIRIR